MELASKYAPSEIEGKWYEYWLSHKLFSSKPDGREPYTVVIPPPNVTGVLHMGHMLNNTIQDILVRKARLEGKNAGLIEGKFESLAELVKDELLDINEAAKRANMSVEEFEEKMLKISK